MSRSLEQCLHKILNRLLPLTFLFLFLFLLHFPFSLSRHHPEVQPPVSPPGFLLPEIKTRLGSSPPSCHNKCNGCHPCMAVQVPTLPGHNRARPGSTKSPTTSDFCDPYQPPGNNNRYSNYKPLRWKCSCGDHFYNP